MRVRRLPSARALLLGVSATALLGLAACDGPPAPEPMAAPPPDQSEAYADGREMEEEYDQSEDGKPPEEEEAVDAEDEEVVDEQDYAAVEPPEVVAMAPIPNPRGYDRYGRRLRPGQPEDGELQPYQTAERPADYGLREKPPEIADAADPVSVQPSAAEGGGAYAMAPIPNPPGRDTDGRRAPLAGGPVQQSYAQAYGPPPGYVSVAPQVAREVAPRPSAVAEGARVRVPIAPAAGSRAPGPSRAGADLRGRQGAAPSPEVRSLDDRVAAAATDLRRSVETGAVLETPETWVAGQTREVTLRFPDGFGERLRRAARELGGRNAEPGEVTASLSGEGFRIDPAGPQSVSAEGAGQPLVWRVTPERADPGDLRAEVQAVTPAGSDNRTLSLGTVGGERGGGLDISARTLGWGILILLVVGFVAWLVSRRPEDPEGRNRRRVRAEAARRDRPQPFDLSSAPPTTVSETR